MRRSSTGPLHATYQAPPTSFAQAANSCNGERFQALGRTPGRSAAAGAGRANGTHPRLERGKAPRGRRARFTSSRRSDAGYFAYSGAINPSDAARFFLRGTRAEPDASGVCAFAAFAVAAA